MSLPSPLLSLLSRTPPQTCFFGADYVADEAKQHKLLAIGSMLPKLDRFSCTITKYGAKYIGKDKAKCYTEFLDVMAQMRISFTDPNNESFKSFFTVNGVDTRHDNIWEMYLMDPQLRCDYVVQCHMNDPEKVASVLAYVKG